MTKPMKKAIITAGYSGKNTPANAEADLNKALEVRRVGRMSTYTAERAAQAIEVIESGGTVQQAADAIGVERSTIWAWGQMIPSFQSGIAAARASQGLSMADDAVKIVDNATLDASDPKHTAMVLRKAEIQSRVRIRMSESLAPDQFSTKSQGVTVNVGVQVNDMQDFSRFKNG